MILVQFIEIYESFFLRSRLKDYTVNGKYVATTMITTTTITNKSNDICTIELLIPH